MPLHRQHVTLLQYAFLFQSSTQINYDRYQHTTEHENAPQIERQPYSSNLIFAGKHKNQTQINFRFPPENTKTKLKPISDFRRKTEKPISNENQFSDVKHKNRIQTNFQFPTENRKTNFKRKSVSRRKTKEYLAPMKTPKGLS